MTQIVESLFGVSPERYQEQKDAALQQEALAYAQLDPYQRASAGIYAGARGLASGIGRMLGGEDPGMRRVTEQDQIIRSINLNDPETYGPAAQRAYQMGHTELAQKIMLGADTAYQRQEATRQRAAQMQSRQQTAEAQAMLPNLMREARPEQMVSTDDTGVVNTIPAQAAGIDPDIQRRLMGTAIGQGLLKSFGEAQKAMQGEVVKPNIAPINIKDFTPESVKAYLNSLNPGSLVPVAQKSVSPYTPIDPSKYTQDSLKAYGLSGQVSDLVPLPTKAANAFAPINVKDFTPESVKAFVASQNPADLVPLPTKATNPFAPINVKDYTSESLEAYGLSGKVSDLVPVAAKAEKPTSLINQIDASKFTPASVAKFSTSQNYADLEPIAAKTDKPASLVNQIDASKFTPSSVSAFSTAGGDYSLLVPVVSTTKADRTIANVNPNDFTPKSLDKYLISGKYADLVPVSKTGGAGGGGTGGAAGTGTVEVVDPKDRTKTIIVTKARAVAESLTPAKAIEGLTPQMRQKLEATYPQATSSLRGHQNKSAMFIRDLEALRDSPGLDSVTGFAAGRAPGLTDAGRAAVSLYDKVVAKGGFQALQDLRDASKTGGALGNISNTEGKQLIASFAAIDRKQSAKDVREAINQAIDDIKGSNVRLKDAYDLTYEYRKGTAAPSGVDANNPLLK